MCPSARERIEVCVQAAPLQAASTVLAIQTLLNTKPLPDLSLCRDIWTLVNRSNSTKEWCKNGREMEEKKD